MATTPLPHRRGKIKKKREQRSNFKCNSATTPIKFIPQRHSCVHPAGGARLCVHTRITSNFKMLCWLCTMWSFLFSRFVLCYGFWWPLLDSFFFCKGDLLFSRQTQFNRSSQKLLYEQFKRLTTDWRDLRQRIGRVKTGTSEMSPGFLENQLAPPAESLFLLNCVVEKAYFQGLFKMKTKAKCCYFILRHKILNHIREQMICFSCVCFFYFVFFSHLFSSPQEVLPQL